MVDRHRMIRGRTELSQHPKAAPGVDLINVNMPEGATVSTPRRVTTLARLRYGRLFQPGADGSHNFEFPGLHTTESKAAEGSDEQALAAGFISVTPMRFLASLKLDAEWKQRLEF